MLSSDCLGSGAFGAVFKISCTISQGKDNRGFQALDKNRVVKFESEYYARREYGAGKYALHLHMKKPIKGRLVMRNLGEKSFAEIESLLTDPHKKLALTKELLKAYEEQLIKQQLEHGDLHSRNILVKVNPDKNNPFEVNIIDFGLAVHIKNGRQSVYLLDFYDYVVPLITRIWKTPETPNMIRKFLAGNHQFNEFVALFDKVVLSPCKHSQKSLDQLLAFLEKLTISQPRLSEELKKQVLAAVEQSTSTDMQPLQEVVARCRATLHADRIEEPSFPVVVFDNNKERQLLFNQIEEYYHKLEKKGECLCSTSQQEEGKQLCVIVSQLRKKTWEAIDPHNNHGRVQLLECRDFCKSLLEGNKHLLDIRRNNNYIWAEVGVILGSLIVLYPIALGINYLVTRRLGFFTETESAKGAKRLDKDFEALEAALACQG
ncbi:AarF/UbiB family protein [Legionella micdadei]|nr:AarF/UbiB family protein [Legionella micdadei]